jgi:protein-L-isoaspartate O-methyltransferase
VKAVPVGSLTGMPPRRPVLRLWRELSDHLDRQGADYLHFHRDRLWATYRMVAPHVGPGTAVLSVGGGSAYVEAALARFHGGAVTVVDFPQAIAENRAYYQNLGFAMIGADLTAGMATGLQGGPFDMLLSSEIVEHVPESPRAQLAKLVPALGAGGRIFVTTPNLGSLRNMVKLALNRPIAHDPDLTFAPVTYENEGVHRREYTPTEIEDAMRAVGARPVGRTYCWYRRADVPWALRLAEAAVPRWRQCMIVHGQLEARV